MTPTTLLSATYFWASDCATAAPCSTGVSPVSSWILRPSFGASVFTAYLAQLSCSLPRKPAPPVSGVTMAIFSWLLQLRACAAAADCVADGFASAAVAATAASAATQASAMALFMNVPSLGWSGSACPPYDVGKGRLVARPPTPRRENLAPLAVTCQSPSMRSPTAPRRSKARAGAEPGRGEPGSGRPPRPG